MMPTQRLLRVAIAATLVGTASVAGLPSLGLAQGKSAERISLADARKALGDGKAALDASKFDEGVRLLDVAINSKRLSHRELARALYYRGLGYRGRGELANAVSDFTAALWMKNGLSEDERKAALAARASTYEAAGLSAQGQATAAAQPSASSATTASATPAQSSSAAEPAANSWSTATQISSQSGGGGFGSGLNNFFSGLFGGGGSAAGTTTASTTRRAETTAPAAAESVPGAAWAAAEVAERPTDTADRLAASAQQAAASGVKIQVAAMRGQSEATSLANRLTSQFGSSLAGRSVRVTDRTIGSMGKFYLVEMGPFPSEREIGPVCEKLRNDGLDCHIVQ